MRVETVKAANQALLVGSLLDDDVIAEKDRQQRRH